MDRELDQARAGVDVLEPRDRGLAGVRAAVVEDPEHALGGRVGLAAHDLLDEPLKRVDPGLGLAAAQQPGVMDVRGGQVGQRPAAAELELDQRRATRAGRDGVVAARERLQLGLLIGADHELARMQPPTLKPPGVEVEPAAGLGRELRVAREDPRALLPRLQRAVVQPAPDRRRRRVGAAPLDHQTVELSARENGQAPIVRRRQFARHRDDLGDLAPRGNGAGDPRADYERAAHLLGAATAIGTIAHPDLMAKLEQQFFDTARAHLGDRRWSDAVQGGRRLAFRDRSSWRSPHRGPSTTAPRLPPATRDPMRAADAPNLAEQARVLGRLASRHSYDLDRAVSQADPNGTPPLPRSDWSRRVVGQDRRAPFGRPPVVSSKDAPTPACGGEGRSLPSTSVGRLVVVRSSHLPW
jgi:hypothetical protein